MSHWPEHVAGCTTHARRGALDNAFRYGVDFVLIDPDETRGPALFSRNRFNLAAVHDRDHGGPRGDGRGAEWARAVLAARGLEGARLMLLTQPRCLGYWFNPVSFFLAYRGAALVAVIAEVNTPMGDRHSYAVHHPDFAPISPGDRMVADKHLHVSPFQDVAGRYAFRFNIGAERIAIRIAHENGEEGVIATLSGPRRRLSNAGLIGATLRRPLGALRTMALIHWQALKLWAKGARFRPRPAPPAKDVT